MVRFEHFLQDGYICLNLFKKRTIIWLIIPFILCNHYISSGNGQGGSRTDNRIEYEYMVPEVSFDMFLKLMSVICNFILGYRYQICLSSQNELSFHRKMNIMESQKTLNCQDKVIFRQNTKPKPESPRLIFSRKEF